MKEAMLYEKKGEGKVFCRLCNHFCTIAPGRRGRCGVRENRSGILTSLVYGKAVSANASDPIEKKPLFHFYPGSRTFSIATVGCNFTCVWCQNCEISQMPAVEGRIVGADLPPEEIVVEAERAGCRIIAYTYTEPTVFFEYAYDTGRLARERGLKNVFVSNGFMTAEAVEASRCFLDAVNVDLKAFREETYGEYCGARLAPVLDSIRRFREMGVWVEVTTLIVPGINDAEEEIAGMARFLASVGREVPWHLSAYIPRYRINGKKHPPTPAKVLRRVREIGLGEGLRYVYTGNLPGDEGEKTLCPACGRVVVDRLGYTIGAPRIRDGRCAHCGEAVDGVGM